MVYAKIPVGNHQFVIEWDLMVDSSEDQGEVFEVTDCELLSISAFTEVASGPNPTLKVYHTNQGNFPENVGVASAYVTNLSDAGLSVLVPWDGSTLPPAVRFIAPRLEGGASQASAKVSCLFREL